ncbi:unnamed protein product [Rotaria sordida]|uniref:Uncharacterized protein n=1 Tax=Rotaria sordida TaxID=392033 RepID=A0A814L8Q7_9BILA|nr:unnamed protein product [Rotaria sordida]CAF1062727.1 unnamed protein product [Rotaria sordida]
MIAQSCLFDSSQIIFKRENMFLIIGLLLILYITYRLYQYLYPSPNIDPHGKYVLISGCDTGFGHTLAIELDKKGFNVFASVYKEENQVSLKNKLSSRAIVFRLDITQSKQIDAAYKIVKEKTNILHALVNNAGIDQDGLIDWITLDFMRNMMEINFFGHVAMTKTFLPLLISKRGSRVINLCSVAGYLVAPSMSSYCATKYAFESFSDCLRREMRPWGLHVSIVEPSYMRTPIIEGHIQTMRKMWDALSNDVKDRWGKEYFNNLINKRTNNIFIHFAENPVKVVQAIQHAVINTKPCIRYRPGWQSSLLFFPLSMIPTWITDLLMDTIRGQNVIPAGVHKQL